MGRELWSVALSVLAGGLFALHPAALAFPGAASPLSPRPLDQIERSVTRPVPVVPRREVAPPDGVWVPDRFVRVPGVRQELHVPAHWERRLPSGELYAPPIVACGPGTSDCRTIPAGPHPPRTDIVGGP